jgi:hypothetical protein
MTASGTSKDMLRSRIRNILRHVSVKSSYFFSLTGFVSLRVISGVNCFPGGKYSWLPWLPTSTTGLSGVLGFRSLWGIVLSVFVRFKICYCPVLVWPRYIINSKVMSANSFVATVSKPSGCDRRTCERGSMAVGGRDGGVPGFWSLAEPFRISLTGAFLPFDCAAFPIAKIVISISATTRLNHDIEPYHRPQHDGWR